MSQMSKMSQISQMSQMSQMLQRWWQWPSKPTQPYHASLNQQTRQDSRRSGVVLGENKKRTNKTEKDRYRVHFPKTFNVKQYDK